MAVCRAGLPVAARRRRLQQLRPRRLRTVDLRRVRLLLPTARRSAYRLGRTALRRTRPGELWRSLGRLPGRLHAGLCRYRPRQDRRPPSHSPPAVLEGLFPVSLGRPAGGGVVCRISGRRRRGTSLVRGNVRPDSLLRRRLLPRTGPRPRGVEFPRRGESLRGRERRSCGGVLSSSVRVNASVAHGGLAHRGDERDGERTDASPGATPDESHHG